MQNHQSTWNAAVFKKDTVSPNTDKLALTRSSVIPIFPREFTNGTSAIRVSDVEIAQQLYWQEGASWFQWQVKKAVCDSSESEEIDHKLKYKVLPHIVPLTKVRLSLFFLNVSLPYISFMLQESHSLLLALFSLTSYWHLVIQILPEHKP